MTEAVTPQKARRAYKMLGHYKRVRMLMHKGFASIDGRTWAGRQAKAWREYVLSVKGGDCVLHIRQEIDLATMDLWILLSLADAIVEDARKRGALLNKRAKTLPRVHDQYNAVNMRFAKRVEALELDKGPVLDLARRLMLEQRAGNGGSRRPSRGRCSLHSHT